MCLDEALGTSGVELKDKIDFAPSAWVDAIFGIGLKRAVKGLPLEIIRAMNRDRAKGVFVISADVPSGLDAESGLPFDECVCASHTVTFERKKPGHLLGAGPDVCGEISVCPIGIPDAFFPVGAISLATIDDARSALKPRPRLSHKGTFGHLLIIAGSLGMAGAAAMSAMAALRSGAGLVSVACPASIVPIMQTLEPCAMCVSLPEEKGVISPEALGVLKEALKGKSALVIGPGLTRRAPSAIIASALESGIPSVVDADALNIISEHAELKALLRPHHVITPHPGEAARLLDEKIPSALACAKALRALGATVVLKGASSIIMGKDTYISISGCAGLAKGGSGDVLAGMIGAMLAQGYEPEKASWIADVFHGTLGQITANDLGQIAMTSRDLISHMRKLWGDGLI